MDFDQALRAIQSNITREITLFNYKFESILKNIEKETQVRAIELLDDPLEFDYVFGQILRDTGYYNLVNEFIDNSYDKSYDEIKALFASTGLTAVYTEADIAEMLTVKNLDIEFFKHIGNDAATILKRDLYKYTMSDMRSVDVAENIRQSLQGTGLAKYSKTYMETSISKYNQSLIDLKSKDVSGEVYIYRGVDDSHNRKFCQCLLDQHKYYNKNDAQAIKSDKRREYNCRHLVVPVSKEWAEDRNYTKGSFTC